MANDETQNNCIINESKKFNDLFRDQEIFLCNRSLERYQIAFCELKMTDQLTERQHSQKAIKQENLLYCSLTIQTVKLCIDLLLIRIYS